MIREYTYEAGVRNFERAIATSAARSRGAWREQAGAAADHAGMLDKLLGPPQYSEWLANEVDEIGVANVWRGPKPARCHAKSRSRS